MDPRYPPKNRRLRPLPQYQIHILHEGGKLELDTAKLVWLLLNRPRKILDYQPAPGKSSILSLEPALVYLEEDLEIALDPDEMMRFLTLSLDPWEATALRKLYGDCFQLSNAFYAEDGMPKCRMYWPINELEQKRIELRKRQRRQ